jgi:Na+/H+-dicarboxylate symporter
MRLLVRIVIAIAAGIGAGFIFPEWLACIFVTFNGVFSAFLGFIIPLLIVGFVAPAIADIGNRAGKMLVFTALLAYFATCCAGFFSYFTSNWLFPSMIETSHHLEKIVEGADLTPYFTISIEPIMTVMSALVLAFTLGLCVAHLKTTAMRNVLNDFREIIEMTIRGVIIPLLPLYIFGIFLDMTIAGQVATIMATFAKIILVIFVMHVVLLVAQYCIAALFSQMGIDKDVAGFVIPLCATIHMSGSAMKIVACALALMITLGQTYDFGMFAGFIAMIGLTIVAAPGVPGGAIMASLGLLSSMLGFSDADNALIIALYIAMDSFGTACNVTGDGALAQIVNRFFVAKETA